MNWWRPRALQFINSEGLEKCAKRADALAAKFGERFAVPKIVRDKVAKAERIELGPSERPSQCACDGRAMNQTRRSTWTPQTCFH